ncbi:NADH dehydrogenase [ubiquinone] 1 alpha subcomplex assembly factor 8 [Clarias gariepinus]|uniref:NADH dehydrogenase [ubiquinone] 1 alpha subcomplex assembly factor 8 n=1 Tax=Clarias gariepinus TaxID=13013 RepID=UPI00234DF3E7|nr:NADH dehydrogenase [ubiquinone] 1 alpha subcomplex assembly factor 8 [Clarias gariepinus]
MSGRNAWASSRERIRRFPELLARCSVEAAAYGKCVVSTTTGKQELKKDFCLKEFKALKTCFIHAANQGMK